MGKRSAVVELFLDDMGSILRETRPSIQREDQLTMETKLEQIAAKCCEPTSEERWCGKSARHVLWEPGAGDRLRRPGGCGNGATVELVRHRQTKGAATDMFGLTATAPHSDFTRNRPRHRVPRLPGRRGSQSFAATRRAASRKRSLSGAPAAVLAFKADGRLYLSRCRNSRTACLSCNAASSSRRYRRSGMNS